MTTMYLSWRLVREERVGKRCGDSGGLSGKGGGSCWYANFTVFMNHVLDRHILKLDFFGGLIYNACCSLNRTYSLHLVQTQPTGPVNHAHIFDIHSANDRLSNFSRCASISRLTMTHLGDQTTKYHRPSKTSTSITILCSHPYYFTTVAQPNNDQPVLSADEH